MLGECVPMVLILHPPKWGCRQFKSKKSKMIVKRNNVYDLRRSAGAPTCSTGLSLANAHNLVSSNAIVFLS